MTSEPAARETKEASPYLNRPKSWFLIWLCLTFYSAGVHLVAFKWGYHICSTKDFVGYFQKMNWLLMPLYWSLIIPLVYYSWTGFLHAWDDLAATEVLHSAATPQLTSSDRKAFLAWVQRKRGYFLFAAAVLGVVINVADVWKWAPCYWGNDAACLAGGKDFNVAWFIMQWDRDTNLVFTVLAYLNQYLLIVLASLIFLQMSFHILLFSFFESFGFVRDRKVELTLRFDSPLNEFGLEAWNSALNNVYWLLSVAILIPIASRYAQPVGEKMSSGQIMIQYLVPPFFFLPMIFTIVQRQLRLPKVWAKIRALDPEKVKKYHDQRIWPMDKNWASKLGIIIAMGLLSYLVGSNDYKPVFEWLKF